MNKVICKNVLFAPLLNYLFWILVLSLSWQPPLLQSPQMYKYCDSILVFRRYWLLFLEFKPMLSHGFLKRKYVGVRLTITYGLNLENCYRIKNRHKIIDLLWLPFNSIIINSLGILPDPGTWASQLLEAVKFNLSFLGPRLMPRGKTADLWRIGRSPE